MNKLKFCVLLMVYASVVSHNSTATETIRTVALSPAQIFAYNADAIFTIYTSENNRSFLSSGSGFFVCSTGIAVTNHHVIAGWPYAVIRTHSGQEFRISGFYSYDLSNDLAIIQAAGSDFPYVTMGDSNTLRIGDSVFAIGSPLGHHNTFSSGMVSRFSEVTVFDEYRVYGMIQITAPMSPGSSGGALLNEFGQVIGITTAAYFGGIAQALNFAVPIARVDLTGTEDGRYLRLPIAEAPVIAASDLLGTWLWGGGHYVFNANGTGSRVWDGVPGNFRWRISDSMLVLDVHGGGEEVWGLTVINAYQITIGGASFRAFSLAGAWDWDNGWYVFNANGTGSREWDGIPDTFRWNVTDGMLTLRLPNGNQQRWPVAIINSNEITIGGAHFTRAFSLAGVWDWSRGWYAFDHDGTGSRLWDGTAAAFQWDVTDGMLILGLLDGKEERWPVNVLSAHEVTIGGAFFERTTALPEALTGAWDWESGWYVFNHDGTGSREWDGIPDTFQWNVTGGMLILRLPNGNEQRWAVNVVNANEITIGGAFFTRSAW